MAKKGGEMTLRKTVDVEGKKEVRRKRKELLKAQRITRKCWWTRPTGHAWEQEGLHIKVCRGCGKKVFIGGW